jgi:hypothetical protein
VIDRGRHDHSIGSAEDSWQGDGTPTSCLDLSGADFEFAGDRRPLDPGESKLIQVNGQSWQQFTPTLSMIGRVVVDQEQFDPGTRSDATEPYGSTPLITIDTSGAAVRRTRALLEGGLGWREGAWGFGMTAGWEGRDNNTILSGVVRHALSVQPGVSLGVSRRIGGVEVGLHGRYRYQTESINLTERASETRVYELRGYTEVRPIDILTAYYRRRDQHVVAGVASAQGRLGQATWTVYGEISQLKDRLTKQEQNDPAQDRWDTHGWSLGGSLQRRLGGRGLLTAQGRYAMLTGNADLAMDSSGVIFTADERLADGEAELRLLPGNGGWTGAVTVGFAWARRVRNDSTLQLGSDIQSATPTFALDVGRRFSPKLLVVLSAAIAAYGPTSSIPDPSKRGPVYRTYFAPELDVYSSSAVPKAFSVLVQWKVAGNATLWLTGRTESVSSSASTPLTAFTPSGSRSASSIAGGVTLGNR